MWRAQIKNIMKLRNIIPAIALGVMTISMTGCDSYLAIDQCTIAPMIENYRTGLLWKLFMSCPEIQQGLNKLGFKYN